MADPIKVFCSHTAIDKPRVEEVATKLAKNGIDPWLDKWEMFPGDDLVQGVNKGLDDCDVVLIFISKAALESGWVQAEMSTWQRWVIAGKKRMIPVLLEHDVELPALPGNHLYVHVEEFERLVAAIKQESQKPTVVQAIQERHVRLTLQSPEPGRIGVTCTVDGQPTGDENISAITAGFAYSYADWMKARLQTERTPAVAAPSNLAADLDKLGNALGEVLFPEQIDTSLQTLLDDAAAKNQPIEFSVETADSKLLSIPFEAAMLSNGRILSLEPGLRMVRRDLAATAKQTSQPGPLKILVAVGAPDEGKSDSGVLDPEAELQAILDAVGHVEKGKAFVRILEVGSLGEIRKELKRQPYHVLHLSGHGSAGTLQLETEDGDEDVVTPRDIATAIRESNHAAPLVFLAACHSGLAAGDGPTEVAGFAQQLLRKGVPQVLAMQSKVSDGYATALAGAFYRELAGTTGSAALALARARADLERNRRAAVGRGESTPPPEFATPSLFRAGVEQPLLDLVSKPVPPKEFEGTIRSGAVPMLPVGDLIGRRKELRELMWVLRDDPKSGHGRKAGAQLIGMGGVGKSSLAGRAMQRLKDDRWTVFAHSGRWELGSLAEKIGKAVKSQELIAASSDNERIDLIGRESK